MDTLLDIRNLEIIYETQDGIVRALNKVDLSLAAGVSLGLVGETGAGKTTLAKGVMRLTPMPPGKILNGQILFRGRDLLTLPDEEIRDIRGRQISMVFQDPMTSLNPVMTVGDQISEAIVTHAKGHSGKTVTAQEMLELVGISPERAGEYPHQFSGGMKQRVVIAIALACNPKLLIADEPTTALDVTIQAQVLETMTKLRKEMNTAMILISHDLGVVAQNCEYVAIIYAGEIVEYGTVHEVFKNMRHPYTIGLFNSIPNMQKDVRRLTPIEGLMPDPMDLPTGCKFHTRCAYAKDVCRGSHPEVTSVGGEHTVRCFLQDEIARGEAANGRE